MKFNPDIARDEAARSAYPESTGHGTSQWRPETPRTRVKIIGAPPARPTWFDRAACKGQTKVMYPFDRPRANVKANLVAYVHEAFSVCAGCPVAAECNRWAEETRPVAGVYAGHVWSDGKRVQREWTVKGVKQVDGLMSPLDKPRRGRPSKEIEHGTQSGYNAHRYRGELPCDACRVAHGIYRRTVEYPRKRARRNGAA